MINSLLLSAFLLFSPNPQTFSDNIHQLSTYISKPPTQKPSAPPINITVVNKNEDSNLLPIITLLFGIFTISFQVYLQHRSNLKLQKENARDKLKLTIYEKIEQKIATFYKSEISSYLNIMQISLETALGQINNNAVPSIIDSRVNVFMLHNETTSNAAIQVCFLIEIWEIISPEFKVFRLAINSALHDLREAFSELYPHLLYYLPIELPIKEQPKTVWPHLPNNQQYEIIKNKILVYLNKYNQLVGYMHDIQTVSQNILLGNLFKHRLAFRKPLDPKFIAINFDLQSVEEWIHYFEHETNWGVSCRKSEENVISQLNSTQPK